MFGRKSSTAGRQAELTDQEILEACSAGGARREKALSFLYKKYMGYVYDAQKKYHQLSQEELRDAYSEAVVGLSRQIDNEALRGESSLGTYLFRSFSNRCVDKIRRQASNKADWVSHIPNLPDRARNMLQDMVLAEKFQAIAPFLKKIGEKCRQILLDAEYYGYSLEEIAVRTGSKNTATVSSLKHRCMKRLRDAMGITKS